MRESPEGDSLVIGRSLGLLRPGGCDGRLCNPTARPRDADVSLCGSDLPAGLRAEAANRWLGVPVPASPQTSSLLRSTSGSSGFVSYLFFFVSIDSFYELLTGSVSILLVRDLILNLVPTLLLFRDLEGFDHWFDPRQANN